MSKHHVILKSKTLDVPIIITSSTTEENQFSFNEVPSNDPVTSLTNSNKFKLDKGFSLDSHYLKSQNSLSSSSTSNDLTSSSNSISSSNSSLQQQFQQFQFYNQQYLQPPPSVNLSNSSSNQTYNINADFDVTNVPLYEHVYEKSSKLFNKENGSSSSNPNIHLI